MISLRLVIDTNVVVSAALKPDGLQRSVLTLALTRPARLFTSSAILMEYAEVLARPELHIRRGLQRQVIDLIRRNSRLIKSSRTLSIAADPDDNRFLECADASRADYLITGNLRHFPSHWKQTKVVNARQFMGIAAPHFFP